jgi:hypothetical protein
MWLLKWRPLVFLCYVLRSTASRKKTRMVYSYDRAEGAYYVCVCVHSAPVIAAPVLLVKW